MSNSSGSASDNDPGRNLWESARNLVKASADLEALFNQVIEAIEGASRQDVRLESEDNWEDADGSDWVSPTWAVDLEVSRPNAQGSFTLVGTACLCLRLYDPAEDQSEVGEGSWSCARVPKLFCAYWPGRGDESFWDTDELSVRADGTSEGTIVKGHTWRRSVRLRGGKMAEAWFFCVPVTTLTETNLQREVIGPFLTLLASDGVQEDFPSDAVACVPPASAG